MYAKYDTPDLSIHWYLREKPARPMDLQDNLNAVQLDGD